MPKHRHVEYNFEIPISVEGRDSTSRLIDPLSKSGLIASWLQELPQGSCSELSLHDADFEAPHFARERYEQSQGGGRTDLSRDRDRNSSVFLRDSPLRSPPRDQGLPGTHHHHHHHHRVVPDQLARDETTRENYQESPQQYSVGPGPSPGRQLFEKRPRRKTRPDRYESHRNDKKRKRSPERDAQRRKRKPDRRQDPLRSSREVMTNFHSDVVHASRVSMKPRLKPGLFRNARTSLETPNDLAFHDLFLPEPAPFNLLEDLSPEPVERMAGPGNINLALPGNADAGRGDAAIGPDFELLKMKIPRGGSSSPRGTVLTSWAETPDTRHRSQIVTCQSPRPRGGRIEPSPTPPPCEPSKVTLVTPMDTVRAEHVAPPAPQPQTFCPEKTYHDTGIMVGSSLAATSPPVSGKDILLGCPVSKEVGCADRFTIFRGQGEDMTQGHIANPTQTDDSRRILQDSGCMSGALGSIITANKHDNAVGQQVAPLQVAESFNTAPSYPLLGEFWDRQPLCAPLASISNQPSSFKREEGCFAPALESENFELEAEIAVRDFMRRIELDTREEEQQPLHSHHDDTLLPWLAYHSSHGAGVTKGQPQDLLMNWTQPNPTSREDAESLRARHWEQRLWSEQLPQTRSTAMPTSFWRPNRLF